MLSSIFNIEASCELLSTATQLAMLQDFDEKLMEPTLGSQVPSTYPDMFGIQCAAKKNISCF